MQGSSNIDVSKDGMTIHSVSRYVHHVPEEYLQREYEFMKDQCGRKVIDALMQINSRCVVEYEEKSYREPFAGWMRDDIFEILEITIKIKPVQYHRVVVPVYDNSISMKPFVMYEDKLKKWIKKVFKNGRTRKAR